MDELQKVVLGKWVKTTLSECSKSYPDELDFRQYGVYFGKKGEERREFTIWDAGDYQVISDELIKISTANDEEILYRYWTNGKTLKFKDDKECEFTYRKVR